MAVVGGYAHENAGSTSNQNTTGAAEAAAGAFTGSDRPYEAPGVNNVGGINPLFIAQAFSRGSITPQILEYIEKTEEELKRILATALRTESAKYRRIELRDPMGAQAFVVENNGTQYASIIIFSDILTPYEGNLPASMRNLPALNSLKAEIGDVYLLNTYVIRTEDLDRSEKMASALAMDLAPVINPELNIPLALLGSGGQLEFTVDTRLESVRQMANRLSPHALTPRIDMGFVVSMRLPRDRNNTYAGQVLSDNVVPFLVVGAYTEVTGPYQDATNRQKFVPAIRRPVIYSTIPTLSSIILAEVLSQEYFVRRGMWKRYFSRFSKDSPNLGQVLPDVNNPNALWFAPDIATMEQFVADNFTQPMMLTEVVEGHYRIPDISLFSGRADDYREIIRGAATMFGVPEPTNIQPPTASVGVEYIGSYGQDAGVRRDTRDVTYLDQVAKRGNVDEETRALLCNYTLQPNDKATLIANLLGSSTTFLFQTSLAAIDPEFTAWLSRMVPQNIRLVDTDGTYSSFTPVGNFMARYTDYQNCVSPMFQQARQVVGQGSYIRRYN